MMKRNNNNAVHGVDPIDECFLSMDRHKLSIENNVKQDLFIIFAGLKEYL